MATELTRRNLVKGVLGSVAVGALVSPIASATPAEEGRFERTIAWDAEYDVIVIGFGGAGANTAIAAADEGARVLLLEKAPEGYAGGNSNVCGQFVCSTEKPEGVKTYFQGLRTGWESPSDEMLDVYIQGMVDNRAWLEHLNAPNITVLPIREFPDMEGADCFDAMCVAGTLSDGSAYNLFKDNVLQRSELIDVWYEAPAEHLIQDPATKIVHGVVVQNAGNELKVRAKNGVVLACGGWENNPQMQNDYNHREFWPSLGHALYNTGDGVRMGLEVGADLWHMGNIVTNNCEFVDPETGMPTFVFGGSGPMHKAADLYGMMLAPDGSRVDETYTVMNKAKHGKVCQHGTWRNASFPSTMYYIWDQNIQDLGAINDGWSADGAEEVARGWVAKADTPEELLRLVGLDEAVIPVALDNLERYNSYCRDGFDPQFGRTEKMSALVNAPFYGVKITPCTTNTQGGPRRGIGGEVLDPQGDPIPHLYEAGELGDIWSNLYQAGCNLGGGLIFGRISGRNAASVKDDSLQEDLVTDGYHPEVVEAEYPVAANQYIGKGKGKGQAPMAVRVTIENGVLTDVEVLEDYESRGLAAVDRAFAILPAAMVAANSAAVDVVTSATRTSVGLMAAVADALSQVVR